MRAQLLDGVELGRVSPVADLIEAEATRPEATLLRWPGSSWTVREFASAARRCAAELRGCGIQTGDRVAVLSGNSAWRLAWQFGIWWIGAVEVSVNSELKGDLLDFVLADCDPALLVAEREFTGCLHTALTVPRRLLDDAPPPEIDAATARELDAVQTELAPSTLATILYTSGTTGSSKGVMLPRGYFSNQGAVIARVLDLDERDTGYFVLPFFHVDFHVVLPAVIQSGSSVAFDRRFSARRFWPHVREFGCTWAFAIGAVLSIVRKLGAEPAAGTTLRRVLGAPIPDEAYTFFEDRLGIDILSMFGQTEADGPTFETTGRRRRGSAGTPCSHFDVEIHDDRGHPVAAGTVGEIVYRPHSPDLMMLGYWRRDDATVAAWRNLWFHSGDLGRMDDDGFLYFVGRMTDSMRRRGENISAYELEMSLRKAPGVQECASIGVVDEVGGEDEIKVFVVPVDENGFDVDAFFDYCERQLPRYAVPRYVEITSAETFVRSVGTGVIQKRWLSRATSGAGVHDRENLREAHR
ncbi:AMP-binding protein [Saccharopolyspora sp. ASAGF58]|uniref:AMP-binding protein n=1 Tax=Saccharopolyspora sp. ASAGF58 TaxID=2719023 RepID=UPI00143FD054|nr:AMP-binding protein [Saccharopolyspora sp. ASAGF58]QIZ37698.1 ATP-dependent acyl-CoA ligase [Saccharopolyspora sp. ASAGF58]